jgi:hypothetical protein
MKKIILILFWIIPLSGREVKELFELGEPESTPTNQLKVSAPAKKIKPAKMVRRTPASKKNKTEIVVAQKKEATPCPAPLAEQKPTDKPVALTQASEKKAAASPREIKITSRITKAMTTYTKHWSGNHTPSSFCVTINGQKLPEAPTPPKRNKVASVEPAPEPQTITIANNEAEIKLDFEFMAMGVSYRKESVKYKTVIPEDVNELEALFSWDEDHRIILEAPKSNKRLQLACLD